MHAINYDNGINGVYVEIKANRNDVIILLNALDTYKSHFNDMDYVKKLRDELLEIDKTLYEVENDVDD